jgi:hypothetical protein
MYETLCAALLLFLVARPQPQAARRRLGAR